MIVTATACSQHKAHLGVPKRPAKLTRAESTERMLGDVRREISRAAKVKEATGATFWEFHHRLTLAAWPKQK
jgi:hypothetical protein